MWLKQLSTHAKKHLRGLLFPGPLIKLRGFPHLTVEGSSVSWLQHRAPEDRQSGHEAAGLAPSLPLPGASTSSTASSPQPVSPAFLLAKLPREPSRSQHESSLPGTSLLSALRLWTGLTCERVRGSFSASSVQRTGQSILGRRMERGGEQTPSIWGLFARTISGQRHVCLEPSSF